RLLRGVCDLLPVRQLSSIALHHRMAIEAHDLVEQLRAKAVHDAHDDDQRSNAQCDGDKADARDEENEPLAFPREQIASCEHALAAIEDHEVSFATADSRLNSSRSPVERRFNSTVPLAIPLGPMMTCHGSPMRSIEPSLTPPRSSRSS